MKKKVIVTGGCGYIGSHTVIELIENNFEVTILDNLSNSSKTTIKRIQEITGTKPAFIELDLKNIIETTKVFKTLSDKDIVIHFAAHKAVGESVKNPLKYYQNNFFSLINTLISQSENGINNFIFSSDVVDPFIVIPFSIKLFAKEIPNHPQPKILYVLLLIIYTNN